MDLRIKNPNYYVGVRTGDFEKGDYHMTLITEVDNIKNTWKAENDKKPKSFTKDIAEELVVCLEINGVFAVVVYSAGELVGQPFVEHKQNKSVV